MRMTHLIKSTGTHALRVNGKLGLTGPWPRPLASGRVRPDETGSCADESQAQPRKTSEWNNEETMPELASTPI